MDIISQNEITIAVVPNRIDANNAAEVELAINGIIKQGPMTILCDFSLNEYISSAGLRVFLLALKSLNKSGRVIALCSLKPQVKSIFDMAGFINLFKIFNSRDEAVKSLKE